MEPEAQRAKRRRCSPHRPESLCKTTAGGQLHLHLANTITGYKGVHYKPSLPGKKTLHASYKTALAEAEVVLAEAAAASKADAAQGGADEAGEGEGDAEDVDAQEV